jgi:8-oxo-dGTP diphosphatase
VAYLARSPAAKFIVNQVSFHNMYSFIINGCLYRQPSVFPYKILLGFIFKNHFLQQFRSFGTPQRVKDPELTPEIYSKRLGIELSATHWVFDYYVTVGFYTLTEYSLVSIIKKPFDEEIQWWPISELPALMFDHKENITEALKALQMHIYHYPVGYELLPEKFTLPEIHSLYETILGKSLDSRNFARKLMATGIVKKLSETKSIGAHRSPFLYTFDKKKYNAALKNGMFLAF